MDDVTIIPSPQFFVYASALTMSPSEEPLAEPFPIVNQQSKLIGCIRVDRMYSDTQSFCFLYISIFGVYSEIQIVSILKTQQL